MKKFLIRFTLLFFVYCTGCTMGGRINNSPQSDSDLWTSQYSIAKETLIQKLDIESAMKEIEVDEAILFLSSPDCPYCQIAFPLIDELASTYPTVNVIYVEAETISQEKRIELNEILGNTLIINSDNEIKISVPDVYAVKNNKVLGHQQNIKNDISKLKDIYESLFQKLT